MMLREESKVQGVYGDITGLNNGIVQFLANDQYKIEK